LTSLCFSDFSFLSLSTTAGSVAPIDRFGDVTFRRRRSSICRL
jgi:hypothetical protein